MSQNAKIVKGISFFLVLVMLADVVTGILMVVGADAAAGVPGVDDPVWDARIWGVILAVIGVLYLVTAVLGIRGANNPQKLKPYTVMCGVMTFLNLAEFGQTFIEGTGSFPWVNLLLAAVCFSGIIYASKAMQDATRA